MERKKCMAIVAAGLLAMSAAGLPEIAEAAVGGMRAPRMTAPRMNTPRPQTPRANTPSGAQNARPNQQYRPSQKASDVPAAAPRTASPSVRQDTNSVPVNGTRWGNVMRNMGLFAGGMMLGGLLGHLFGFGAGSFMGDLFGLLMNGLLIYFVIRLVSRFWHSRSGGSRADENAEWRTARDAAISVRDIRPPQEERNVSTYGGTDYDPKRTADRYRSR